MKGNEEAKYMMVGSLSPQKKMQTQFRPVSGTGSFLQILPQNEFVRAIILSFWVVWRKKNSNIGR